MTNENQTTPAGTPDAAAVQQMMQQMMQQMQGGGGMLPAASAIPQATHVNVPIKLRSPNGGSVRIYLSFEADANLATPQGLMQLCHQLAEAGFPLDVWQPKPQQNRGGFGGHGGGGGAW